MSDWKKVKIGELLTESKIESTNPSIYKRIRVRLNVKGVEKRPLENEVAGATKQYVRRAGQFIYGKQNFHKGAFGIIPQELDGFETSSDIPSFDVAESCIPEWIYYFFKLGNRYLELEKLAVGVGSKRISPSKFFEIVIPLPDIGKQRQMMSTLKIIENKGASFVSQIERQNSILKNLRQQILQDAISGKLTADWRVANPDAESASKLLEHIKAEKEKLIAEKKIKKIKSLSPISEDSVPFELPEKWKWCRLGNVGLFERGKSKHRPRNDKILFNNGDTPLVQTGDVAQSKKTNYQVNTCKTYYNEIGLKQSLLWSKGTLCITIAANIAETGFLGMDACFPDSVVGFNPLIDEITSKYVQIFIEVSKSNIQEYAPATAQKNINLDIISQLSIPFPPRAEQRAIVAKVERLMGYVSQLQEKIAQNANNTETLMQSFLAEVFKS